MLFLLTACSQRVYLPALTNNDISYMPKPMSSDSDKTASYLSGSYYTGTGSDLLYDKVSIGQLSYSMAKTYNNFNIAYAAYGFVGNYKNTALLPGDTYYFDSKSLYGLGGRFSGDYYTTNGRTDNRFGLALSCSKEMGDFLAFRNLVKDKPNFISTEQSLLFTAGISTELIVHSRKYPLLQYSVSIFAGHGFTANQLNLPGYILLDILMTSGLPGWLK